MNISNLIPVIGVIISIAAFTITLLNRKQINNDRNRPLIFEAHEVDNNTLLKDSIIFKLIIFNPSTKTIIIKPKNIFFNYRRARIVIPFKFHYESQIESEYLLLSQLSRYEQLISFEFPYADYNQLVKNEVMNHIYQNIKLGIFTDSEISFYLVSKKKQKKYPLTLKYIPFKKKSK